MKIAILTTADHVYANYILKKLLFVLFPYEEYLIIESSVLFHKMKKVSALLKYIKISGLSYVISQIIKIYFIKLLWVMGKLTNCRAVNSSKVNWKHINTKHVIIKTRDINHKTSVEVINNFQADLIISIYFNQIISKETLTHLKQKNIINIHPSLLPEYKGVSPTFWVLADDKGETGITIHEINDKIDEGGILAQKKIRISSQDSEHSLFVKCSMHAVELLKDTINNYKNKSIKKIKTKENGSYKSIPQRKAVVNFKKNKKKFFTFKELIKNFNQIMYE